MLVSQELQLFQTMPIDGFEWMLINFQTLQVEKKFICGSGSFQCSTDYPTNAPVTHEPSGAPTVIPTEIPTKQPVVTVERKFNV